MNTYKKSISVFFFAFFLIFIFIFSCKTSKLSKKKNLNFLLKKEVIKNHNKKYTKVLDDLIFNGKASVLIGKNYRKVSFKMNLKLKEKILAKAYFLGFPLGEASITPTHIEFQEKFSNIYLHEPISFLKNYTKIELSHDQIERLVQGKPLFNLLENEFDFIQNNEGLSYNFISFKEKNLGSMPYQYKVELDQYFFIKNQKLSRKPVPLEGFKGESFLVEYKNWMEVKGSYFPKSIFVFVNESQIPIFSLEFSSIEDQKNSH